MQRCHGGKCDSVVGNCGQVTHLPGVADVFLPTHMGLCSLMFFMLAVFGRMLSQKVDTREETMALHKESQRKKSSGCCWKTYPQPKRLHLYLFWWMKITPKKENHFLFTEVSLIFTEKCKTFSLREHSVLCNICSAASTTAPLDCKCSMFYHPNFYMIASKKLFNFERMLYKKKIQHMPLNESFFLSFACVDLTVAQ